MFGIPTNGAAVTKVVNKDAPVMFDYLEAQLDNNEYFLGNSLSIADFALASPFVNAAAAGFTVDSGRWPNLVTFVARTFANPAFNEKISI